MKINLKTAVNRLFPTHSLEMVYIEAVANALDANATKIEIALTYKDSGFSEFKIKDNGVGLDEDRYYRFSNLMETSDSSHKGQGRLVYLHYFNDVSFESVYENKNNKHQKISFNFNVDFKENNCKISPSKTKSTGTTICFRNFCMERVHSKKELHASRIKEKILAEFLPCFQKIKENANKSFTIIITSNVNEEYTAENISEKDIPEFESTTIEVGFLNEISKSLSKKIQSDLFREPLTLYFDIKETKNKSSIVTSFAVDNRAMNVDIIDETNYLKDIEAVFFLVSKNFDGLVDGTRQELTISNSDKKKIKKVFKDKMTTILNERVPQFSQKKAEQQQFFEDKYPHLYGYLPLEEVGFTSKKDILNKARDKFFEEQRDILEKEHLDEEDYQKALELSSRNLAEYIIFRQKQIDKLKSITADDREKIIHDLISPQKNRDTQNNLNIFRNNAWILDDRFMTFSHSFSDIEMAKISEIELFGQKSDSKNRPDFLMLFSKPLESVPQEVDIVIFEFKRLNVDIHQKYKAATELRQYASDIKDIFDTSETKIGRIWLYGLVDLDDKFRKTLDIDDYQQRFTISGEVWYKYNEKLNVEISFLDFKALVSDADTRNRTFMDILKHRFVDEEN